MTKPYDKINRPFGEYLERESETLVPDLGSVVGVGADGAFGQEDNPDTVKASQELQNLWITNEIKSSGWKPQKRGFYMNGQTGYAEFADVYISGNITAITGNIGGWSIAADELYSGNVHLQSTAERILMGNATEPLTGTGIFLGKDGSNYEFRAGNPSGDYIHWDGTNLSLTGDIDASGGTIGGWTIGATTLTGGGVTLDSSGEITGGLIQTSSSGLRTVLDSGDDKIKFMNGGTTYASIVPYVFAGGNGLLLETFSGDSYLSIQEGTTDSASLALDASGHGVFVDSSIGVTIGGDLNVPEDIRLGSTTISGGGNWTLTLPSNSGSSGQYLQTDGSGNTSWGTVSVSGFANTSLSNLTTTSVNQTLIPGSTTLDLGTSALPWDRLYVDDIYLTNNDGSIYYNGNIALDFFATNLELGTSYTSFKPAGTASFGSTADFWTTGYFDNLWLNSDIDMNSGDITEVDRISGSTGTIDFSASSGTIGILDNLDMNSNSIFECDDIEFNADEYIDADGGSDLRIYAGTDTEFYIGGSIKAIVDSNFWTDGDLQANGSKPFIIPHPDGSDRLLRYTAQESPEVLLRHRGVATTDSTGKVLIVFPDHYRQVTDVEGQVTVNLTSVGNHKVYLQKSPNNEEMNVVSDPDVTFHFEVIAVRKGYLGKTVEIEEGDSEGLHAKMAAKEGKEEVAREKVRERKARRQARLKEKKSKRFLGSLIE